MDDTRRAAALKRLEPLVGEWEVEARFPFLPGPARGHLSFAWELGGQFLVERSTIDIPEARPITGAWQESTDGGANRRHDFALVYRRSPEYR